MQLSVEGEVRDVTSAVRQASWQFAVLAAVGLLDVANHPDRPILTIAVLTFTAIAVSLRCAPARIWGPRTSVALIAVLFVCLGISTWCADERAIVTVPGFILGFVWLGLHQRVRVILLSLPFATLSYWLALTLAGTPRELAGSALVVMPVAALMGVVLANVVADARRAKAEVRSEERWRAAIMATLAHDVRSPLTSIVGALEIIDDDPATTAHHRVLVQGATRQATRILRLATGLLEVERVDQGRLMLDRHDLRLVDLLSDIAVAHPAIDLELDVRSDLSVWADRERLEQILVNLANNAARHGAPPVTISATSDAAGVDISVRDHGDGVPADDVEHLFERFSSADHSPQSVGLGLWIVRLLAEAHGGSVTYAPAHPGADFLVHLPHADGSKDPDDSERPSRSETTDPAHLSSLVA